MPMKSPLVFQVLFPVALAACLWSPSAQAKEPKSNPYYNNGQINTSNPVVKMLESLGGNFLNRGNTQRQDSTDSNRYRYDNGRDRSQRESIRTENYHAHSTAAAVQNALARRGYYRGAIDGAIGQQSRNAIANYQHDHNLSVTGNINTKLLQSLGL